MAAMSKSLAEMNKSGDGDRATKERSALDGWGISPCGEERRYEHH
jgi:hypothetical protein